MTPNNLHKGGHERQGADSGLLTRVFILHGGRMERTEFSGAKPQHSYCSAAAREAFIYLSQTEHLHCSTSERQFSCARLVTAPQPLCTVHREALARKPIQSLAVTPPARTVPARSL